MEWVKQVHDYHRGGMSYGKIAKLMGMTRNKVLSAHRRFRFGMSNHKFYELKNKQEVQLTNIITLPKVTGICNPKYNYREFTHG